LLPNLFFLPSPDSEGVTEIWLTSEDTGAYGIDIGKTIPELLWVYIYYLLPFLVISTLNSSSSSPLLLGMLIGNS